VRTIGKFCLEMQERLDCLAWTSASDLRRLWSIK
jgi:hypothetical protein